MRLSKVIPLALLGVVVVMWATSVQAISFQAGDLAVLMQGDNSTTPLSNTGNAVNIVDMSRIGTVRQTITAPTTVITQDGGWASNSGLIESGTATSEGELTLSPDGHSLMFAGYIANPATYQLSSADPPQVPRGYATIDGSGNYTFGGTFGTVQAYSENNVRAAVTDGTHVWGAGAGHSGSYGGTMLGLGNTTTGTEVELDTTGQNNSRAIHIFGGNLFYSTQKGTDGIHYYSGLPTSDSPADHLLIATGNTDSLNDFDISPGAIQSAGSYVYLVDSRVSSGNGGGGVQRWNWNGSAYQLAYTFTMPGSDQGMEGLAVDFSTNTIFATTPTHVYEVTDTGVAPPGLAETMTSIDTITDTVHYAFRGIALAPTAVPEPGSIVLLVTGLLGLLCYAWRRRK